MTVDTTGFEKNMQEQKDRSRSSRKNVSQQAESDSYDFASEFVGYTAMESESTVLHVDGNIIILDKTPFYVESGGQISDTGIITVEGKDYKVTGVKKSADAILHFIEGEVSGDITGKRATASVEKQRRQSIMRNHSATHLLHEALKRVLGSHIQQQGSLVAPDYLRFDYNHFEKMTPEQMTEIENMVNSQILEAHTIETNVMSLEEAQNKDGLKMYFGDKYGETVRAVIMDGDYSQELCGGTHVGNTSEIGFVKITSESSIASGIRRIEAITTPNTIYTPSEWDEFTVGTYDDIGKYYDATASVNDNNLLNIKLFPNPTNGNELFIKTTEDTKVSIYNILGKTVKTTTVSVNKNSVDISNLKKGVYIVKLNVDNKIVTKKLIKN